MSDIRNLDLASLSALALLLEERSVTRAAARLSLTQSAVSGMLARLRKALGDPLFVRTSHGMVPTPRAVALETPLRKLLDGAHALVAGAAIDPARLERTFAIGGTDYMQMIYIAPLIAGVRKRAPHVRIAVRHRVMEGEVAQLASGEMDLAITIPALAAPGLVSRTLCKERYVGVAGRKTKIPARPTLDDFCARDHVVVSPSGGGFSGPVDDALTRMGRSRKVALSLTDFLILPAILNSCDVIAAIPERLARVQGHQLRIFELPLKVQGFDVIAVWHQRVHDDGAHQWLRDLLAKTAATV